MQPQPFTPDLLRRPKPGGIDVVTTLAHFAIITYTVSPTALRPHVHPRFELELIQDNLGRDRALLSVVPFLDQDFRFVRFPWAKWRFGQTNYRVYVRDPETGERGVWFFGTVLDSATVAIPRYAWQLPWHRARMQFDCRYDFVHNRYQRYALKTESDWASAEIALFDSGQPPLKLPGFDDLETALVVLTHPLTGWYLRRNGTLGTYAIWHDRLRLTAGRVETGRFRLLERMGLMQDAVEHSVLIQPHTEFTIYLPPRSLR